MMIQMAFVGVMGKASSKLLLGKAMMAFILWALTSIL